MLGVGAVFLKMGPGFSVGPSLKIGTPSGRSVNLSDAAIWSDRPGSYIDDGVRGLGGGLEYVVSSDFCAAIIPRFVDRPACEQVQDSVQQTFDLWAKDNPKLRFVNVSGRTEAKLPPPGVEDPWSGFGAEIDLLALTPGQYGKLRELGAWTRYWYVSENPLGTQGGVISVNSLTSADIVFNANACFYLDSSQAEKGCNNFAALLLHEIGHTFGLGHFDDEDNGFYASDHDQFIPILSDCEPPYDGPGLSALAKSKSVMDPDQLASGDARMELTGDELVALHALYPNCPGGDVAPR